MTSIAERCAISTSSGLPEGIATGKSFGFSEPEAIVSVGASLFVANLSGDSVTEINADTMKRTAIISASDFGLKSPSGLAVYKGNVWVTNYGGGSVTEFSAATRHLFGVFHNGYLPDPGPITVGGGYLYAASPPGGSPMVTRINPGTYPPPMPWMECDTNKPDPQFDNPQALIVVGTHLWVVDDGSDYYTGGSLSEVDVSSGNWVRSVH